MERRPKAILRILLLGALLGAASPAARALHSSPAGPWVGRIVARLLEEGHYSHKPIGEEISRLFLRNYIESYDYGHLFFSRADVEGFEAAYGTTLGSRVKQGDLSAAYGIYERFMARLKERRELLRSLSASTMTFTANESMPSDWHKMPWPAGDDGVLERWRLNVKSELLRSRLDGRSSTEAVKDLLSHYDSLVENYEQFDADDVRHSFLSALCRVFDPHTDYFAAPGEANFDISMRLSLVGIGAVLRFENGYTRIVSLIPGGPAEADDRLKPGYKIEGVAQGDEGAFVDVVGMKIDRVVSMIRGVKGTVVRLRVIDPDAADPSEREIVRLVRDKIDLKDQEARAKVITVHPPGGTAGPRIGVIELPSFYTDIKNRDGGKSSTRDVDVLMRGLLREGVQGVILDLRRNGGGSLDEALALTGLFIGAGPVVQVKDGSGEIRVLDSRTPRAGYGGPLVVLTSRGSASASEIVSAALQDYGRAVIIGEKSTFGKGTVQSVIGLDRFMPAFLSSFKAGAVHLTVQKFYRVSGGSTQNRGVLPDIRLPAVADEMDIAESALPNALPYDEIPPVAHPGSGRVRGELKALEAASAARVSLSPEWGFKRADIEFYRGRVKAGKVSLNLARRLKEKEAAAARAKTRREERAARGVAQVEEFKVTLNGSGGVSVSTAAVMVPARSTGTVEGGGAGYAGPPDMMLVESANVLADLIERSGPVPAAARTSPR